MTRVYLSLGSNIGDRLSVLRAAVRRLGGLVNVRFVDALPLHEGEGWGGGARPPRSPNIWC